MGSPPSGDVPRDLAPALAALPLFPLPQTVLFPGALLALHVFEPRYRTMIRDVLATHNVLSVVLIDDPNDVDARGNPTIARVAGVGIIVDHAELPSGRFNLLLRGRARVRLTELPFVPPYRRAAAEVIPTESLVVPASEASALVSVATAFASLVRTRDASFDFRLPKEATPAALADVCAHHLVLDARERQTILETLDPIERVRRVTAAIASQRATLAPNRGDLN